MSITPEADGSLNCRPADLQVPGQSEPHSKTLSQKTKKYQQQQKTPQVMYIFNLM